MTFNPEIHRRRSVRLKGYCYSRPGYYYITICSWQRECLFGHIAEGTMIMNRFGHIVERSWFDLINHNKNIILDAFIVMPNHVHGIIRIIPSIGTVGAGPRPAPHSIPVQIKKDQYHHQNDLDCPAELQSGADLESAPTINRPLSEIVRQLKSFSTRRINLARDQKGCPVWQRSFYDHVIRSVGSLDKIREYIMVNPVTWGDDKDNPDNPGFLHSDIAELDKKSLPWDY